MLRLEALPHFCKALCRGTFSAKRQVRLSLHLLPCVAGPPVLQLSQSSPEGSVEKQFSGWGTWGVREKVYFFAEEEGGLEEGTQIVTTQLSLASVTCSCYTRKLQTAFLKLPLPFPSLQAWSRAGHTHLTLLPLLHWELGSAIIKILENPIITKAYGPHWAGCEKSTTNLTRQAMGNTGGWNYKGRAGGWGWWCVEQNKNPCLKEKPSFANLWEWQAGKTHWRE